MDASLNSDQLLLTETAARLAAELGCPPPAELPSTDDDPTAWQLLSQTGFSCMHVGTSHGGGGAHSSDVFLVVEAIAARTCISPYLGQGVLAPELAWRAACDVAFLTGLADGTRRVTIGLTDDLRAMGRVGSQAIAWDARGATHALLLDDNDALCLVELTGEPMNHADITRVLRRIPADASHEVVSGVVGADSLVRFEAFAISMLAAELLGVMHGAVDAATDHVADRVQFGVPVGTFQAVQHLAADAKVLLEGSRSAVWSAAWAADELDPPDALLAAHQAKAYTSRAALEVVEIQTQMLGGIAITWEERAHVRVRRVLLDRLTLGDERAHEDAIASIRLGEAV